MKKTAAGFSLIELLIAVLVVGILAAIAIPTYTDHMTKTRRTDGMAALTICANGMERHYTQTYSYLGAGTVDNDTPVAESAGTPKTAICPGSTTYYNLTILGTSTATFYTLRATPIATTGQSGDGIIELDSTGARRWDENNTPGTWEAEENDWTPG